MPNVTPEQRREDAEDAAAMSADYRSDVLRNDGPNDPVLRKAADEYLSDRANFYARLAHLSRHAADVEKARRARIEAERRARVTYIAGASEAAWTAVDLARLAEAAAIDAMLADPNATEEG